MRDPYADVDLRAISVAYEDETGFDSVPTIEEKYPRGRDLDPWGSQSDAYGCVFPHCRFRANSAERMWRHVHFGRKHHRRGNLTITQVIAKYGGG